MMRSLPHLVSTALICVAVVSCAETPKKQVQAVDPANIARGSSAAVQFSVYVEAVDAGQRLITLKGPRGNAGVYEVGEQVQRLSEIRAGDKINGEYQVAAVAELREPTAEEKSAPLVSVEDIDRAPLDAPPAGSIQRTVRVVTTIDALDRSLQTLTVKGPLEGLVTVHVADPKTFERLQIGQSIVVTFDEALTLAVEPGTTKS